MRSDFDTWLVHTYGFKPNGDPMDEAADADSPQQFLTRDGTFDVVGYERWVERMKAKYDVINMVRLSDGSYGAPGSLPASPTNLLPAPAEPTFAEAAPAPSHGSSTSGPESIAGS
jgi:hypothetical protein